MYQGPETTASLACSRHRKEANGLELRGEGRRVAGDHGFTGVEEKDHRRPWGQSKNLGVHSE